MLLGTKHGNSLGNNHKLGELDFGARKRCFDQVPSGNRGTGAILETS